MSISAEIMAAAKKIIENELENTADRAKRALIRAADEALLDYYEFPEGEIYHRLDIFKDHSFQPYELKRLRNPRNMHVTVGVVFALEEEYPEHSRNVTSDEIFSWNLEGYHGSNGQGDSPLQKVHDVADKIAGL